MRCIRSMQCSRRVISTASVIRKQEIVERYRAAGSELLRSDEDGAISIAMDAQNFRVDRYRTTHARYWQHEATPSAADL